MKVSVTKAVGAIEITIAAESDVVYMKDIKTVAEQLLQAHDRSDD